MFLDVSTTMDISYENVWKWYRTLTVVSIKKVYNLVNLVTFRHVILIVFTSQFKPNKTINFDTHKH